MANDNNHVSEITEQDAMPMSINRGQPGSYLPSLITAISMPSQEHKIEHIKQSSGMNLHSIIYALIMRLVISKNPIMIYCYDWLLRGKLFMAYVTRKSNDMLL